MRYILISLALFLLVLIEGSLTTMPLIIVLLLLLFIVRRDDGVFPLAFGTGILFDMVTLRPLGISSLFLIVFLFMISLYERKFEVQTFPFVGFASFFGSFFFLLFCGYAHVILQSLCMSFFSILCFTFLVVKRNHVLAK